MADSKWFRFDAGQRQLHLVGRTINLPKSRLATIVVGILFLLGGFMWFLPVLGAWMLPVGLLILSLDWALARRWRRKATVWQGRRRNGDTGAESSERDAGR